MADPVYISEPIRRLEEITPARAQYWLAKLDQNPQANKQRLSPQAERNHVDRLARIIASGQRPNGDWDPYAEPGLLIGANELCLNGRHRLMAIVQTGITVRMYVTYDPNRTSAQEVTVDQNLAVRSYAYTAGIDEKHGLAVRFLLNFIAKKLLLTSEVADTAAETLDAYTMLIQAAPNRKTKWQSGPILSAFILRMQDALNTNDQAEIARLLSIHVELTNNDPRSLPVLVYKFWQQQELRKLDGGEKFVRMWRALDPKDRDTQETLMIKDMPVLTNRIRQIALGLYPSLHAVVSNKKIA